MSFHRSVDKWHTTHFNVCYILIPSPNIKHPLDSKWFHICMCISPNQLHWESACIRGMGSINIIYIYIIYALNIFNYGHEDI